MFSKFAKARRRPSVTQKEYEEKNKLTTQNEIQLITNQFIEHNVIMFVFFLFKNKEILRNEYRNASDIELVNKHRYVVKERCTTHSV